MNGRVDELPRDGRITSLDRLTATIRGSLIDADLANFPVGVEIPAASGFLYGKGATDWNYLHAISCGQECYIEVDQWNITHDTATLWVKVPAIRSGKNHKIDLYFGADNTTTYVGETGDAAAQAVWDSNYIAVYHMSQDPSGGSGAILDSTSNANNGTSGGSMTSGDLVDGVLGKALDFDGVNDYFYVVDNATLRMSGSYSLDTFFKSNNAPTDIECLIGRDNNENGHYRISLKSSTLVSALHTNTSEQGGDATVSNYIDGAYHHLSSSYNSISSTLNIYFDGSLAQTYSSLLDPVDTTSTNASLDVGAHNRGASNFFDGKISFATLSNTARSAAWIKATNAVLNKTLVSLT